MTTASIFSEIYDDLQPVYSIDHMRQLLLRIPVYQAGQYALVNPSGSTRRPMVPNESTFNNSTNITEAIANGATVEYEYNINQASWLLGALLQLVYDAGAGTATISFRVDVFIPDTRQTRTIFPATPIVSAVGVTTKVNWGLQLTEYLPRGTILIISITNNSGVVLNLREFGGAFAGGQEKNFIQLDLIPGMTARDFAFSSERIG